MISLVSYYMRVAVWYKLNRRSLGQLTNSILANPGAHRELDFVFSDRKYHSDTRSAKKNKIVHVLTLSSIMKNDIFNPAPAPTLIRT